MFDYSFAMPLKLGDTSRLLNASVSDRENIDDFVSQFISPIFNNLQNGYRFGGNESKLINPEFFTDQKASGLWSGFELPDLPGGYNPDLFDPKPLNPKWGNNDIPYDLAITAPGLFGNVHGLNAILSRFVGSNMPPATADPVAPGNTWIYTLMNNPWL